MAKNQIDDTDKKIINLLSKNNNLSYAEIGEQVFVSAGTVHVRLKKMQKLGIIRGSKIQIDYTKLGYDIKAFLGIYLANSELYDGVLNDLKEIPEVVSADYTTGNYSMFIMIRCKDTQHLREVLHDKIQHIKGIARTETIISLSEDIERVIDL